MVGISNFVSIILVLIDHGIPVTRLMASGADEAAPLELAPDHPVEIAMRDQRGDAALARPGDQDIRGLGGAAQDLARILDPRMEPNMPQDARHHGPFGNPHGEQGNGGGGTIRPSAIRVSTYFGTLRLGLHDG